MSINVSQFHIITHAGPVSSTVVGHLKTVLVIGLGWTVRREPVGAHSAAGIVLALVGIFGYVPRGTFENHPLILLSDIRTRCTWNSVEARATARTREKTYRQKTKAN